MYLKERISLVSSIPISYMRLKIHFFEVFVLFAPPSADLRRLVISPAEHVYVSRGSFFLLLYPTCPKDLIDPRGNIFQVNNLK
jgi:hypothetical protein